MREKRHWCEAACLFPFLAAFVICAAQGVYPFGDRCILHVDMYHQYCPFFMEFLDKLQNGGSLMYTWREGLGSDFVALYAYYLASPLNWLLSVCPKQYVIEFMTLAVLVKIALAGLGMFLYLYGHFALRERNRMLWVLALVCSSAYAMSGFVAAYSWNIMWMDGVFLAPLVVYGLERLVGEGRPALYYVALSVLILSNYYIGMLVCVFLLLYFFVLFFGHAGKKQALARFAWYSLLAGGSAAGLLVPEAVVLSYSGSAGVQFPEAVQWYFGIFTELARSLAAVDVYTGREHYPNLYAGAFTLLLVLLYAGNSRIRMREKIPRLLIALFFLAGFSCNLLDFFWHGFHFPDSLPGRQSFLYIFWVLVLGFSALSEWRGIRIRTVLGAGVFLLALIAAGGFIKPEGGADSFSFLITGLFVACYVILLLLAKLVEGRQRRLVCAFACILALAELTVNLALTGFSTTGRTAYLAKTNDYGTLLSEAARRETGAFYRVEIPERGTKNDSARYAYRSATEFSSLTNINVSHFYQSLYMEGGKNFYSYNGATPLTSAMLSVKYVLLDDDGEDGALRKLLARSGDVCLYENRYVLPVGFLMPDAAADGWYRADASKIENLNRLAMSLGAESPLLALAPCRQEAAEGSTTIEFTEDGIYYMAYETCSADSLTAEFSSGRKRRYAKTTHRYLLELGECGGQDTVTVKNSKQEAVTFRLYRLDLDALDAAFSALARTTLSVEDFSDTELSGTIDVKEAGRLVLSVPYQAGWTLFVDGGEVAPEAYRDAFISTPLAEGRHTVRLVYRTPGLWQGAVIGLLCVLLFFLSEGVRRKRQ